ncbi:helix-turn-helix domain-containing protein [Arcticibacter sp.]|uniref:helix-turn-helix domain-containing protein n=1 Tax=Arcticibacter sp. TaxID=1872630 RepID=UPI0038909328
MSNVKDESLGVLIKKAIIESGKKQSVIAKKMNISRQSLNQIDRRKTFDLEFLQLLKEASGIDFTNYIFNPKKNVRDFQEDPSKYVVVNSSANAPTIDFSLTVKIRAEQEYVNRVSDLLMIFRAEANKMGFSII